MIDGYYEVTLELRDGTITEIELIDVAERAKMICEAFGFTFNPGIMSTDIDADPNLRFSITMRVNFLNYQHYLNVLMAFAQEFQLSLSSARPVQETSLFDMNTLSLPADA